MSKFKYTPVQELWLSQLEKHPERQTKETLGHKNIKENGKQDRRIPYFACCLGEAAICISRIKKNKLPFNFEGDIYDDSDNYLSKSYKKMGLRSEEGFFKNANFKYLKGHKSLDELNDNGFTWPQIAKIIRKNPNNIFTNNDKDESSI